MIFHPCLNEFGKPEPIHHPHCSGPQDAWGRADQLATVVPGAPMPAGINGLAFSIWKPVSGSAGEWETTAASMIIEEPPFVLPAGIHKAAAGTVIIEPDHRVWIISPTNQFGGYQNTFAKGTREASMSLHATALKEAYEEAGLRVELTGYLLDVVRTTSFCRFYLARRIGGNPADMGWETQAVHLVPRAQLAGFVTHPKDIAILQALFSLPQG